MVVVKLEGGAHVSYEASGIMMQLPKLTALRIPALPSPPSWTYKQVILLTVVNVVPLSDTKPDGRCQYTTKAI